MIVPKSGGDDKLDLPASLMRTRPPLVACLISGVALDLQSQPIGKIGKPNG